MFNEIKKIRGDMRGFTLTEVMIGMMILTVAIVSASNLLTGIVGSNQNNLTTLQAYYLSQEGLEMVRNIRDTNWLHNKDWLGAGSDQVWHGHFEIPADGKAKSYFVEVMDAAGVKSVAVQDQAANPTNMGQLGGVSPWKIDNSGNGKIYRHLLDSSGNSDQDTGFRRSIFVQKYDCSYLPANILPQLCPQDGKDRYILVQSKVEWNIGARQRELTLSTVLANWKGGAL